MEEQSNYSPLFENVPKESTSPKEEAKKIKAEKIVNEYSCNGDAYSDSNCFSKIFKNFS